MEGEREKRRRRMRSAEAPSNSAQRPRTAILLYQKNEYRRLTAGGRSETFYSTSDAAQGGTTESAIPVLPENRPKIVYKVVDNDVPNTQMTLAFPILAATV